MTNKENETKTCSKCNTVKPLSDYYVYKRTERPWAYCRSCHYSLYTKKNKEIWDAKNPEKRKEHNYKAMKRWTKNNPERWAEIQAKAYQTRKAKLNKEKT